MVTGKEGPSVQVDPSGEQLLREPQQLVAGEVERVRFPRKRAASGGTAEGG